MTRWIPTATRQLRHAGVAVALLAQLAAAQTPAPAPASAPAPVTPPAQAAAKIWRFAGAWTRPFQPGVIKSGVIPLNPAYQAKLEQLQQLALAGQDVPGNEEKCIPNGMPMMMKFGFQLLADASRLVLISGNGQIRFIWTDGRAATPADQLVDSYSGESVAHWDGDTLVIETSGLKSTNEIEFGLAPTRMRITERWRLQTPTRLEDDVTISDPSILTKPWHYVTHYTRGPLSATLLSCVAATDRSGSNGTNQPRFDLTPPAGGYIPPGAQP